MILTDKYHRGVPTDRRSRWAYCRKAYAMSPHGIGRWHTAGTAVSGIAFVQSNGLQSVTTTASVVMAANVTAGNFLVACLGYQGSGLTPSIPSNGGATANVTWTLGPFLHDGTNLQDTRIYYGFVSGTTSTPPTFTTTVPGGGNFLFASVSEWSGIKATTPLDQSATSTTGNNGATATIPTLTQTIGNQLFIGFANSDSGLSAPINGFTLIGPTSLGNGWCPCYLIATDAASHGTTSALTTPPDVWDTVAANFLHA